MKVSYYSHASFQMTSESGVRLLTDPWLYNPIYGNMIWQFPECRVPLNKYTEQDLLYISHNHPDHFCIQTLSHFRRDIPIIIRCYPKDNNPIKPSLIELGFHKIIELNHRETYKLRDISISLFIDFSTVDSAAVIADNNHAIFFQNDCMLSMSEVEFIGNNVALTAALLFFASASMYPSFFKMGHLRKVKESRKRNQVVFKRAIDYAEALKASYIIPCAGDCVYFRLPEVDLFCSPLSIEFKEYVEHEKHDFKVVTPKVGDCIDLNKIEDMATYLKPDFRTRNEWFAKLEKLRSRSDVKIVKSKIEDWEEGFEFNALKFEKSILEYCKHVEENFNNFFCNSSIEQTHVSIAIIPTEVEQNLIYIIEIDFQRKKCSFHNNLNFNLTDLHASIEVKGKYLAMVVENVLTFDDLKAGYLRIDRTASFCREEASFWHFLSLFSSFSGWRFSSKSYPSWKTAYTIDYRSDVE